MKRGTNTPVDEPVTAPDKSLQRPSETLMDLVARDGLLHGDDLDTYSLFSEIAAGIRAMAAEAVRLDGKVDIKRPMLEAWVDEFRFSNGPGFKLTISGRLPFERMADLLEIGALTDRSGSGQGAGCFTVLSPENLGRITYPQTLQVVASTARRILGAWDVLHRMEGVEGARMLKARLNPTGPQ